MTDQQFSQRAAFIREQPALWLFLLYAGTFVGCSLVADLLLLSGAWTITLPQRYLIPLAVVLPMWLGLRRWAGRVRVDSQGPRSSS